MSLLRLALCSGSLVFSGAIAAHPALAQSITPAPDGTGTVINHNGNVYDITGGTTAGTNLFHSFDRLGLSVGEVANFLSHPAIVNIFGRVIGGNPSIIDGLIQANPNLYLMNPAGIIFGPNASLNIGGDFVATTANQIGFAGDQWLNALGTTDYSTLLGAPVSFVFTANNGVIINQGNLEVGKSKAIAFLGSGAIAVGSLTAPDGVIAIASVPGTGLVRLSQPGSLLSYEFVPQPGQLIGTHDVGTLVSGAVGLPQELPSGSTVVSGSVTAGTSEARGLDITIRDLTAAGGITAAADRNVVVDGDISATGDVRLWGDSDGIDGGSLTITNAEIRTGGGDFEGFGRGSETEPHGVSISGSVIDGEGGNIDLDGVGGSDTSVIDHYGVNIDNNSSIVSVDFGQIKIVGIGGDGLFELSPGRFRGHTYGVNIDHSSLNTENGVISLDGAAGSEGHKFYGIHLSDTNITTQQGNILLIGEGKENLRTRPNFGIYCVNCNLQTSRFHRGRVDISASNSIVYSSGTISSGGGGVNFSTVGSGNISISAEVQTITDGNINIMSVSGASVSNLIQAEDGNINITSFGSSIGVNADIFARGDGNLNFFSAGTIRGSGFFDSGNGTMSFESKSGSSSQSFLLEDLDLKTHGQNIEFIGHGLSIGDVDLSSNTGNGGSLINRGTGIIRIGSINTSGLIDGGDVFLTTGASNAAPVEWNAIEIGSINTSGGRDAGDITLYARNDSILISDAFNASGGRDGGDLSITGAGRVITQGINSNSQRNAGDIYLEVRRDHEYWDAGWVGEIDTTAGIISAAGGLNGGTVTLRAYTDIKTGTITMFNPGFNGDGGGIDIRSFEGKIDTTQGDLISASGSGVGGNVSLEASRGISVGDVSSESISTNGGEIRFKSSRIYTHGDIATNDNTIIFAGSTNLQDDGMFRVLDDPNILGESNITFEQFLDGNHNLILEATTIDLSKAVGNTDPLNQLTVNGTLINTTINPTQITTHETIQAGDINSQETIHLRSLNADIQTGNLTTPQEVVLEGQHIQTGNIETDTRLSITTPQTLTTGNITAPTIDAIQTQGDLTTGHITTQNDLTLTSNQGDLTTGNITASGQDVNLTAPQNIATGFIDTSHPTTGGNVQIDGGHNVRIDGTFTDRNNTNASISTAGADSSGTIEIRHGGDGVVPFRVGDASVNGSSGAIARGTHDEGAIAPGNDYLYTHRQDQIAIISRPAPPPIPNTQAPTPRQPLNTTTPAPLAGQNPLENLAYLIGSILNAETVITRDRNNSYNFTWEVPDANSENDSTILNASAADPGFSLSSLPSLGISLNPEIGLTSFANNLNSNDLVSDIDQFLEEQYEEYFDDEDKVPVTAASVRQMLQTIEQQTNKRSVVLYALNRPNFLQLLLIVPDGPPISRTVPLVASSTLQRTLSRFRDTVNSTTQSTSYLQPAQQLYDWLIRPYRDTLNNLNIDTLIFSMDAGLRSIPLAALHDGEQFLIEQYSLGMIPSVSLTNSQYEPLHDAQVLAMGASEFRNLTPLPAVPLELETITQARNSGAPFLNEAFTLDALRVNSRDRNRSIIHLATHAQFLPIQANGVNNSYIQFWDQAANFRDLRSLGWHNEPQVELLVLSACETALGDPNAELGFAGLAVQTGVKSALASLWKVSDVGTLGLMASFYEHLNDPEITIKAEALRQAQLALLRGEVSIDNGRIGDLPLPPALVNTQGDLSHPFFWSGFTLVGSPW